MSDNSITESIIVPAWLFTIGAAIVLVAASVLAIGIAKQSKTARLEAPADTVFVECFPAPYESDRAFRVCWPIMPEPAHYIIGGPPWSTRLLCEIEAEIRGVPADAYCRSGWDPPYMPSDTLRPMSGDQ